MSGRAEFNSETGHLDPPLDGDECLTCVKCRSVWSADVDPSRMPQDLGEGAVRCPHCEEFSSFVVHQPAQPQQSAAGRWPGCSEPGYWFMQIDRKLVRWAKRLGLKSSHVGLLIALEGYRRTWDAPTWVTYATLAEEIGDSEDTIGRRIRDMVKLGLIEVDRIDPRTGMRGSCRVTRKGLTLALAHIAANVRAGRLEDEGLDDLLATLKRAAAAQVAATGNRNLRSEQPQVAATKVEEEKEEEGKEEPLQGEVCDPDLIPADNESLVIGAIFTAFEGTTEVTGDDLAGHDLLELNPLRPDPRAGNAPGLCHRPNWCWRDERWLCMTCGRTADDHQPEAAR